VHFLLLVKMLFCQPQASSQIMVDHDISERLDVATIPSSSELIIGSNLLGIGINLNGFIVFRKLTAGSETFCISAPITITLHGCRPMIASTINLPFMQKGM
jgi:hypothetical protein